jgi:putative glutamine amidotransferase
MRGFRGKPLIAIVLDENTSTGATAYDTGKGYFRALERAGAVAIGLPYDMEAAAFAVERCAGLMSTGARIRFPAAWYANGQESPAPESERFAVERAVVSAFLDADLPYLGICNGLQMLGCLSGCRMTGDARAMTDGAIAHDDRETRHRVDVVAGTRLAAIVGRKSLVVNSFHREALAEIAPGVTVNARAPDGLVEGIERPDKTFALGVQWHPERLIEETDDTRALFSAFVTACAAAMERG